MNKRTGSSATSTQRTICCAILGTVLLYGHPAWAETVAADDATADQVEQTEASDSTRTSHEEIVIVTASRAYQNLLEAPASVSVIGASELEQSAADGYGELLRRVPGVNVVQFGTRDIQLTSRAATSSLATGNLVVVDGRSIYQDFFGFVLWDFAPTDPAELEQIEVVRGPGSSVWGANALTGVVNIRTKKPQDMQGTVLTLGGGEQSSLDLSVVHAAANDAGDLGWKVSASYFEQEAWPREARVLENGGVITPLPDDGTEQPKLDFRINKSLKDDASWDIGFGAARTSGIINTGIGPFDIDDSSGIYYGRFQYQRKQLEASAYVNVLDGDTTALLTRNLTGQPLFFGFNTDTIDLSVQNGYLFGQRQRLVYGGNVRRAKHDLTIAPEADTRHELGAFLEDEIHFTDYFWLFVGARIDDVEDVDTVVSPRVSFLFPVNPTNTFRLSANRAFRAPSLVNQFLDVTILQQAALPIGDFVFPVEADGNPRLEQETITALDAAYTRTWGSGHAEVSVYYHRTEDLIDFRPVAFYSSMNPPPGWPLDPTNVPPNTLPSQFSYVNVGRVREFGVELAADHKLNRLASIFGSYTYARNPSVSDDDALLAVNVPAKHKAMVGLVLTGEKTSGSIEVSYTDEAFWTDVLDSRFFGTTDDYVLVNGRVTHEVNDTVSLSVGVSNVLDEDTPRHIFGDNIGRRALGQVTLRF